MNWDRVEGMVAKFDLSRSTGRNKVGRAAWELAPA